MDIHNAAKTPWKDMDAATKDEIERQEAGGAVAEFYSIAFYDWKQAGFSVTERLNAAYRIKPTTEIPSLPSASTRPADELDLTKLTRICGEWHPETQAAMEAWPHGYEMACGRGWHSVSSVTWIYGTCYRAKPAPKPNLIGRIQESCFHPNVSQKALLAAHALILTMEGGDPDLWAAYEGAIE